MADLVAEMAEHGPVGLAQLPADALAVGVVGLGEVEGDDPVLVAGADRLVPARQQVERQAAIGVFGSGDDGQRQFVQLEDQPSLGGLCRDERFGGRGVERRRVGSG